MGRKLFLIPIVAYHRANLRLQKVPDHAQTDPLVGRKRILHRQEISVWTRGGHHLLHRWGHGVCNRGHEGSSQVPATGADAQQPGMNTIVCTIVSIGVLPWLCRSPFHVVRRLVINGLPSPGPAGWNIAKRARTPRGRRRESGRAASWVWVLVTPPGSTAPAAFRWTSSSMGSWGSATKCPCRKSSRSTMLSARATAK